MRLPLLATYPRQLPESVRKIKSQVKRQRRVIEIIEGFFSNDRFIAGLKEWCVREIKEYKDRATPWNDQKTNKLHEMLEGLTLINPTPVSKALVKRLMMLVGVSVEKEVFLHFCPFCGGDLHRSFFSSAIEMVHCECGAVYFSRDRIGDIKFLQIEKEVSKLKNWHTVIDIFYVDTYVVSRHTHLDLSFKVAPNLCPFCQSKILSYQKQFLNCECGALGLVNYAKKRKSVEKIFEKYFSCNIQKLALQELSYFCIVPKDAPRANTLFETNIRDSELEIHDFDNRVPNNYPAIFAKPKSNL